MNTRLAVCAWLAGALALPAGALGQAGQTTRTPGSIGNTRTPGRISGWPSPMRTISIREAQRMNPGTPPPRPDPRGMGFPGHTPDFGPRSTMPLDRRGTLLPPVPPARPDRGPGSVVTPGHGAFVVGGGTLIPPDAIGPSLAPVIDPRHATLVAAGSGLSVNGAFHDDHFRMKFHVGWPGVVVKHVDICPPFNGWWGWSPWTDWYWENNRYVYIDAPYGVVDPTLAGYTPRPPAQPQAAAEPAATDREVGDAWLAAGDPAQAVAAYRAHLAAYPDDTEVMRLLGLALIDAEDVKEGAAVIGLAYHKDLTLCDVPVSAGAFGPRASDLRRNVNRLSAFAQSTGSSSAWLAMAVLVQAEGREAVARKVLEKARLAGLDRAIVARLSTALGR